ncbi:MAG: hypothetical protein LW817_00455 [Candidatus Caenarcaniphilales bacterium]|jgi:hypothetical protein|nr:hypothetical protein [Candidatus Caenarcaniphilales bacterium]
MDSNFDLDLGRRITIIVVFLLGLWYFLNAIVIKIKSGQLKIPDFLKRQIPALDNIEKSSNDLHSINILQRKILPEGQELWVVQVDDKKILLSKHIQSGLRFLKDLD